MIIEKVKVENSSTIDSFEYDNSDYSLTVNFRSGARYIYERVEPSLVLEFMAAESKGKFLSEKIKKNYLYRRIDKVDQKD